VTTNYVGDAEKRDHVDGDTSERERPRISQQVDRPLGQPFDPCAGRLSDLQQRRQLVHEVIPEKHDALR